MASEEKEAARRAKKKNPDTKKELIRFIRHGGFDKETTESLIKEIEEICAFEDSLKD